jgi:sugar phosphate isomerase/epimerase
MRRSIRTRYVVEDPLGTIAEDLQNAQEAGYEAVELCIMGDGAPMRAWADDLSGADVDALLRECERTGVPITSLSSDWVWKYTKDEHPLSDWDEGVAGLARDVELAAQLGAGYILCHLGTSHGEWEEGKDVLARIGDVAAEKGVLWGFEASLFRRSRLGEFDDLLRMLDELNHPAVGAYDHCHYPRMGKPAHVQVEQIGRRLYGYHSSLLTPETTDYPKLFDALEAVGYAGDWVFEIDWKDAEDQCRQLEQLMAGR